MMDDTFLLYMMEQSGQADIVTTRLSRINWVINQVLRGSSLSVMELLNQRGITSLSDSENEYIINRLLED